MALVFDTARALRTHGSRVALVEAIVAAPEGTQETRAYEWKSQINLDNKTWRFRAAKAVLGFANRDPALALRWFEGCAYFVAGASPGELNGTSVVDAASLEDMLAPYVGKGPAGPDWSPDYVELDGKHVLVITIEPPRMGHPIWTLLKEYTPDKGEARLHPGAVFARQEASTETASPADIVMLARRAAATGSTLGGLSLVLSPKSQAVPIDTSKTAFKAWLDAEREATKAPPEPKPRPVPRAVLDLTTDAAKAKGVTVGELFRSIEGLGAAGFARGFALSTDSRTRQQYDDAVDRYLKAAAGRLPGLVMRSAIRGGLGKIVLDLRNDSPNNFHKVEVELYISTSSAQAYFESFEVPGKRLPTRPIAFGKDRQDLFGYASALRVPSPYIPSFLPNIGVNRGNIDNSGSSRIRLPHVDVRPNRLAELDVFYLVVPPEMAGKTVTATWTATATDASGDMEGTLEIPVMARVPTTADLMADVENDDGRFESEDDE
jgi:hypothetical protein